MKDNLRKDISLAEIFDTYLLISRTRDTVQKVRHKELKQCGLLSAHAAVLQIIIGLGGTASSTEISRWLFRERHSIHELLDRMIKSGLIRKVKDPKRKNRLKVVPTKKGYEAYDQSLKMESIVSLFSPLTANQIRQLKLLLESLRKKGLSDIGEDDEYPLRPNLHELTKNY